MIHPDYDVSVINEKAVRVAAGLLLALGITALSAALLSGTQQPLQPFGIFFLIDMLSRLVSDRSPTLWIADKIVARRETQWVGLPQKHWAWALGAGLAFLSCAAMGFFGAPLAITLALCSVCLSFLFAEAAFGFCVGCQLHSRFSSQPTLYCADGSCELPTTKELADESSTSSFIKRTN